MEAQEEDLSSKSSNPHSQPIDPCHPITQATGRYTPFLYRSYTNSTLAEARHKRPLSTKSQSRGKSSPSSTLLISLILVMHGHITRVSFYNPPQRMVREASKVMRPEGLREPTTKDSLVAKA